MILTAFTVVHVLISLVAIGSGFVVVFGMLGAKHRDGWTKLFLATTVATSVTGYFFPFHGFTPAIAVGGVSLVVLTFAILALYRFHLVGGWRRTYVISSVLALYLNFFVLIVQSFLKVPALNALAPTQSEPPFQIAQIAALLLFLGLGIRATMKFRGVASSVTKTGMAKPARA